MEVGQSRKRKSGDTAVVSFSGIMRIWSYGENCCSSVAAWFTLVCHEHKRNLTQSPSTEKISEMMKLPKGMLIFGDYFKD